MSYNQLTAKRRSNDMYRCSFRAALGLLIALLVVTAAQAQADSGSIAIKAIAEVELQTVERGREISKLVPADRVVSGDWVIYTLEVRNTASTTTTRTAAFSPKNRPSTIVSLPSST